MPRRRRAHHPHLHAARQTRPHSAPFIDTTIGSNHRAPFRKVEEKYSPMPRTAGCRVNPVATTEALLPLEGRQKRFYIMQTHRTIRHQFIEVFHQQVLRQYGQFLEGATGKAFVKLRMERRPRVGVLAQTVELTSLIRFQFAARPPVMVAELSTLPQYIRYERQIHPLSQEESGVLASPC